MDLCEDCKKHDSSVKYYQAKSSSANGGTISKYMCYICFKKSKGWSLEKDITPYLPIPPCNGEVGAKRYEVGVRMDLLIPGFLTEMGKIMCVGAKKYGELNWQKGGLTGEKSGVNHALLHLMEYQANKPCDYGPRHCHLAQVAVNAMFEWWYAEQAANSTHPEIQPDLSVKTVKDKPKDSLRDELAILRLTLENLLASTKNWEEYSHKTVEIVSLIEAISKLSKQIQDSEAF